ncbi:small ribosomal subunit protein eS12-like [Balaenoptera ricei]|uniref:small ribosomal subunit protein eS12-like n=1 Tax=Balaenoptera ricei TaxID=2746895 RepID=UPI0028BE6A56|nr:small ribosomal subunit protein eS12-like [Balaenoptera ricei]
MAEEGIAAGGVMDVNTALEEVLRPAFIHDGLARGIREAAKALGKRQAHLCVLPTVMSLLVGCSCVVVKDYGKEAQAKDVIEEYIKRKN